MRSLLTTPTRAAWAALLLTGAAWVALPPAAQAAPGYCDPGTGVTVIVDFAALGGGVQVGCDPSGAGKDAKDVIPAAGFPLAYAAGQPFVCRVAGKPTAAQESCARIPPEDAYWGLFWSEGGGWTYSAVGVAGLAVDEGGFIGLRWQNGGSRDNPGVAPVHPDESGPKPSPTAQPSPTRPPKPTPSVPAATPTRTPDTPASGTPSPSSSGSPTNSPIDQKSPRARESRSPDADTSPSATASTPPAPSLSAAPVAAPVQDGGAALTSGAEEGSSALTWVALSALVVLGGAAGAVSWRRRSG